MNEESKNTLGLIMAVVTQVTLTLVIFAKFGVIVGLLLFIPCILPGAVVGAFVRVYILD